MFRKFVIVNCEFLKQIFSKACSSPKVFKCLQGPSGKDNYHVAPLRMLQDIYITSSRKTSSCAFDPADFPVGKRNPGDSFNLIIWGIGRLGAVCRLGGGWGHHNQHLATKR